jgi:polysaccharide deacetylase family protein (PEP-CTERM system associated)
MNAFTVDVEDYYQVSGFEQQVPRSQWDHYPSRVVANTERLLELLEQHRTTATFFVLGWVARRHRRLVQKIAAAGHQLGTHSYWHRLVYSMTPADFRRDLRASKQAIEDAAGERVDCYRAPSFSITRRSIWALEILVEEGIKLDSSIFPTRHDRYGIPGSRPEPHLVETPSGTLLEFPPSTLRVAGTSIPVGGGGYFRLYPWLVTRALLQGVLRRGRPLMFYVHPWEIDPDQPRIEVAGSSARFRHYVNLHSTFWKLDRLLATFPFGSIAQAVAAYERPMDSDATLAASLAERGV